MIFMKTIKVHYLSIILASPFNPSGNKNSGTPPFLSHWYGPGWHTLPLEELISLGDALLLNKGWQAQIFTYLQKEPPTICSPPL